MMKKKIIIWGAGGMALGLFKSFDLDQVDIIAFIDNDESKWGKRCNAVEIIPPARLMEMTYDYIFISSVENQWNIKEQLDAMNVDCEKIILATITLAEFGKVFNLFTQKGLLYVTHIAQQSRLHQLELRISNAEKRLGNRFAKIEKRNENLFLKEVYEKQAAEFIIDKFIKDENAPGKNAIFEERNTYYDYVLSKLKNKNGLFLEFGVYRGGSINYLSERIGDNIIYGFDSFEGLPEGWLPGYQKGRFDEEGNMPIVNDNVRLIKGWFDQTLPDFISEHRGEKCAFINIDCDLYSSTKCVLSLLKPNIGSGTIICFDELVGQIGWQDDEYKAFMEFIEETGLKYRYLACAFGGGHQLTERVAVEIL